jgi:ATP-dependent DNA helicase DinG
LSLGQPELDRRLDRASTALRVVRAEAPREEGRHELVAILPELGTPLAELRESLIAVQEALRELADSAIEIDKLGEQLRVLIEKLSVLASDESWDGLRWLDVGPRSLRLNLTPLDVSETLNGLINAHDQSWIFTSATLAIGDDFSHFTSRLGLDSATGLTFPSPYALAERALIYLPPGLPEPSDPLHTANMLEHIVPLFDMTAGGVFCLFTSHRALNTARKWFRSRSTKLADRKLLVQGDSPRDDLLRKFRQKGNAVLLGTGSFWEGVDVRGSALTVVAIDKLPFASPADPLMMARLEYIRRQGGNGFSEHQLPQAVLSLKQGAGRLLRDQNDFGVIVLCDPRIRTRNYGSTFLKCLEPIPSTDDISEVERFFAAHESNVIAAVGD